MKKVAAPSARLVFVALITIQILFGINYVVSKVVIGVFPPLWWASIRIIISSAVMLAFAFLSGHKHPKPDIKFFGPLVGYALLGTIINQSCFLVGLRYTTSTNSAILNTLIPIFTLLIVTLRGQEKLTTGRAMGFFSALAGVLVIRKIEDINFSNQTLIGDLLTVTNCLSYGLFLSFSKKFMEKYDPVWTTTWLFIYGSVGLTILALPDWMSFQWPPMTTGLWLAVAFAILGATLATYFLNFWALAYAKSSHVALFIYLQPVVASLVAWIWFGEIITLRTAFASILIFIGLLLAMERLASKTEFLLHPFKSFQAWRNRTSL